MLDYWTTIMSDFISPECVSNVGSAFLRLASMASKGAVATGIWSYFSKMVNNRLASNSIAGITILFGRMAFLSGRRVMLKPSDMPVSTP